MSRFLGFLLVLSLVALGVAWYSLHQPVVQLPTQTGAKGIDDGWIDDLYSRHPGEVAAATRTVTELGARALPVIQETLKNPASDRERRKAALKACAILEETAAPAVPDVAAQLGDSELTAEAAHALSFMGPTAFPPLDKAFSSDDPAVRREALRSIGKLRTRAGVKSQAVMPRLVRGMSDTDAGVRAVAATYLGIVHEDPERAVPALIAGLEDSEIEVRRASATALGSFGAAAEPAIQPLRRAAGDSDPDLAREAGRALIKLQTPKS